MVNALFTLSSVKHVVQVRMRPIEWADCTHVLGTEIGLKTIEFKNVLNIEMFLNDLKDKGTHMSLRPP